MKRTLREIIADAHKKYHERLQDDGRYISSKHEKKKFHALKKSEESLKNPKKTDEELLNELKAIIAIDPSNEIFNTVINDFNTLVLSSVLLQIGKDLLDFDEKNTALQEVMGDEKISPSEKITKFDALVASCESLVAAIEEKKEKYKSLIDNYQPTNEQEQTIKQTHLDNVSVIEANIEEYESRLDRYTSVLKPPTPLTVRGIIKNAHAEYHKARKDKGVYTGKNEEILKQSEWSVDDHNRTNEELLNDLRAVIAVDKASYLIFNQALNKSLILLATSSAESLIQAVNDNLTFHQGTLDRFKLLEESSAAESLIQNENLSTTEQKYIARQETLKIAIQECDTRLRQIETLKNTLTQYITQGNVVAIERQIGRLKTVEKEVKSMRLKFTALAQGYTDVAVLAKSFVSDAKTAVAKYGTSDTEELEKKFNTFNNLLIKFEALQNMVNRTSEENRLAIEKTMTEAQALNSEIHTLQTKVLSSVLLQMKEDLLDFDEKNTALQELMDDKKISPYEKITKFDALVASCESLVEAIEDKKEKYKSLIDHYQPTNEQEETIKQTHLDNVGVIEANIEEYKSRKVLSSVLLQIEKDLLDFDKKNKELQEAKDDKKISPYEKKEKIDALVASCESLVAAIEEKK